jgi:tRNA threonylcarbamoyl adenosine modification protein (Sua5/YciO/YrdC/YwlC family)
MLIAIHPDNPQARLLQRVADCLRGGGVIAYPTDSTYAYGWLPSQKNAQDRIARIRKLDGRHLYAIACRDLKQAAEFGKIDNHAFAIMKRHTPGPFTFVLPATSQLPKRLYEQKRRTIGIRIPDHRVTQALLECLDEPLMTSSIPLPADLDTFYTVEELSEAIDAQLDIFIDAGYCGHEPTTLVDLSGADPVVIRQGKGTLQ